LTQVTIYVKIEVVN